jgi:hypothetical protein
MSLEEPLDLRGIAKRSQGDPRRAIRRAKAGRAMAKKIVVKFDDN